jgi:hypothetical protein
MHPILVHMGPWSFWAISTSHWPCPHLLIFFLALYMVFYMCEVGGWLRDQGMKVTEQHVERHTCTLFLGTWGLGAVGQFPLVIRLAPIF